MPLNEVSEQHLFDKLLEVFRCHGYEGASLSLISEATGLEPANLDERFSGGKETIARSLLQHADRLFESEILAPLTDSGDPTARIRTMADRLDRFYDGGRRSCLLDTLSLGEPDAPLRGEIRASTTAWIDAMATVANEAGLSADVAKQRAEEALVRIQGSLVVARATGNTTTFAAALKALPAFLTDPNAT